jgi:hypothetical protein
MGEFDDLEEFEIKGDPYVYSRSKPSTKLIRAGQKHAIEAAVHAASRPKWQKELRMAKARKALADKKAKDDRK